MKNGGKDIRTQYERDWDRIIFSSAFRRLQNKTQVFPLPGEVFVHNRLTHSLEVSSVGRSLGKIIGKKIASLDEVKSNDDSRPFYRNSLKNVIASACLAHDLGNPAFGHSGEDAISKYFKNRDTQNPQDIHFKGLFSTSEWMDLIQFEGNANALRILTMQQHGRVKGGFRLTYSTLGSIIKYPCESAARNKKYLHRKKYGYFKIDEQVFLDITRELNMVPDNLKTLIAFKRHPFVFLVEAADDISYNIIDFEDAQRLGLLNYKEVREAFLEIIRCNPNEDISWVIKQADKLKEDKNESLAYLRAKSINTLIYKCAEVFWDNRDNILKGQYEYSLIKSIPEIRDILDEIETKSVERIYNANGVVKLEIAGFKIMSGLVEDFVNAALIPNSKREKEHKKILSLIPMQFSFKETDTSYTKVIHILDFISGMTDLYALNLYRKIRGIEI